MLWIIHFQQTIVENKFEKGFGRMSGQNAINLAEGAILNFNIMYSNAIL